MLMHLITIGLEKNLQFPVHFIERLICSECVLLVILRVSTNLGQSITIYIYILYVLIVLLLSVLYVA